MIKSLVLAAAVVAAVPATAANLVTNGSFENGLTGFTLIGTESQGFPPVAITYGAAQPYPTGAYGEAVPADNATSLSSDPVGTHAAYFVSDFSAQGLQQSIFLKPGIYKIGFDYYAPANGYANANDAQFSGTIAGVTLVSTFVSKNPATTWINYSGTTKVTTAGVQDVTFLFNTNGAPAKDVVIDRVYIEAVPEPAVWGLMLAGFGLIGVSLRRRNRALAA